MTDKHTPTARPWRVRKSHLRGDFSDCKTLEIIAKGCEKRGLIFWSGFDENDLSDKQNQANATHIVKAVNAYDDLMELVEAAEMVVKNQRENYPLIKLEAAIRKVKKVMRHE